MKWELTVGGLLGLAAAFIGGGVFSVGDFIGLGSSSWRWPCSLPLWTDSKPTSSCTSTGSTCGLALAGPSIRIKFADVVDAEGTESRLARSQLRQEADPRVRGGQATAGIRLKRHSLAPWWQMRSNSGAIAPDATQGRGGGRRAKGGLAARLP